MHCTACKRNMSIREDRLKELEASACGYCYASVDGDPEARIHVERVWNGQVQVYDRYRFHGKSRSRLHGVWTNMRERCNNPKSKKYPGYGGRDIPVTVDPAWDNFLTFARWAEERLPSLRSGNTRSCGCLASETTRARTTTHGDHKTRLYGIWSSMKYRRKNTTHRNAHRYSLKGVTVCDGWQNFVAFRGWALANGYMDGKEIDRIDTNLGYSPDNCRWVTKLENLDNRAKYLPADLEEWLHAHARRTDSSPYEVIKAALEAYLDVSRIRA